MIVLVNRARHGSIFKLSFVVYKVKDFIDLKSKI
jgi:hypothetical protein